MKESALETVLRTIPGQCSIHTEENFGLQITVKDCVGHRVLGVDCRCSNSGATMGIWVSKMTYLKRWDETKAISMVLYGFYARASSKRNISYERLILRELRQKSPEDIKKCVPDIVHQVVALIHARYIKTRGEDVKMSIERVKKEFTMLKEHVSEDEVLRWFREIQVQEVMES